MQFDREIVQIGESPSRKWPRATTVHNEFPVMKSACIKPHLVPARLHHENQKLLHVAYQLLRFRAARMQSSDERAELDLFLPRKLYDPILRTAEPAISDCLRSSLPDVKDRAAPRILQKVQRRLRANF